MFVEDQDAVMRMLERSPVADEPALLAFGLGRDGAVVRLPARAEQQQANDGERSTVERVQYVPLAWSDRHVFERIFERQDSPTSTY